VREEGLRGQGSRTGDGLDVRHVEVAAGGQRAEEGGHVGGALETLGGLLVALAVVDLQVHHRAARREGRTMLIYSNIIHNIITIRLTQIFKLHLLNFYIFFKFFEFLYY